MDGASDLDSENCVAGDGKEKGVVKGSKIESAPRRKLADISNLQQESRPVHKETKELRLSLTTREYVERLQKDNATLLKLLAERNKLIELSGLELHKLRINLQKVQQQNLQLAQANSQMLAELNLGKDRLKALHHELGCKNSLLSARKMDLEVKAKRLRCQNRGNEVGTAECNEEGGSSQVKNGANKPCHSNKRRQSKSQYLGPITSEPIHAKDNVENKRHSLRRRSTRFKSEESEPTEDLLEIDKDSGPTTVKLVHAKEYVEKKRRCSRRQSAQFLSQEAEPIENLIEPVHAGESCRKKRHCSRRQSAWCLSQEAEPIENLTEPVHAGESCRKKRHCSRRQSARFLSQEAKPIENLIEPVHAGESCRKKRKYARSKSEKPKQAEDFFEINDAKFPVSPESGLETVQMSSSLSIKKEDDGNIALSSEAQENRRFSVGRPSRRAAEKVQSYKEIPLNVKMRRLE